MVRCGHGVGKVGGASQQVQSFLGATPLLCPVLLVGRHPRAWVRREGSLLRQQHGEVVSEPVLHPFGAGASPLCLALVPSVRGSSSWLVQDGVSMARLHGIRLRVPMCSLLHSRGWAV
jgi:hypothetical protein